MRWRPEDSPELVLQCGRNADADTGDDVWDGSAAYPFPAAAAATTIVSSDANDDGNDPEALGTGARTVTVRGLDSAYAEIEETATLNGTAAVTLTKQYLRINSAVVATAGSGGVNAGAISIKHDTTVLAQIVAGFNRTLQAIYTLPADWYGWLMGWRVNSDGTAACKLALQVRPYGELWRTEDLAILDAAANSFAQIASRSWQRFPPKTDFRVRLLTGGNAMDVAARFDLVKNRGLYLPRNLGGLA